LQSKLSKRNRHSPTKHESTQKNAQLRKGIEEFDALVAELKAEVAALHKSSSTSSKPPSNDVVKLPTPNRAAKQSRGGQPGHPRHEPCAFPPKRVFRALKPWPPGIHAVLVSATGRTRDILCP
jgi:hypothetical protein